MARRWKENRLQNEADTSAVKKGEIVELVTPWNFHRNHKRDDDRRDIYTVEVWTVAAIGKKLMRLRDERNGLTFEANIHLGHELADGTTGFQGYVATLGNGWALAAELATTDEFSQNPEYLTRREALERIKF